MRNIPSHLRPGNLFPQLYQIHNLFAFSSVGRLLVPFLRELGLNCSEPLIDQLPKLGSHAAYVKERMKNEIIDNLNYTYEQGIDKSEIVNWKWPY